ncbi:MAG: nucleotide-binding protein [Planctomycetota bacterium]|jgi:predicted nucleotide-binding protein
MAKLPLEVIDLREDRTADLSLAIEEANRVQTDIEFAILDSTFSDALRLNILSDTHTGTFFDALVQKKAEWRGFHPFIICFVDCALHGDEWSNLFSDRCAEKGIAIVTTDSVEEVIIPRGKMSAYFMYELASHVLALIVSGKTHHRETRQCIYDFHEQKTGILDGMKAGKLCDDCRQWFQEYGKDLSPSQLVSITRVLSRSSELLERVPTATEAARHRVFIGSSMEKGLDIARAVQSELQYDYSVEIWNQNTVFGLGTATIEALEEAVDTYDYGIFIFTPDDKVTKQGQETHIPRDNVIFELGLFIGKLSRFCAFAVKPRDVDLQLPSDLKGMTVATYDPRNPNVDASVGPACRQIRTAIETVASNKLKR